jgi:fructose-1,6-bisphosphatase
MGKVIVYVREDDVRNIEATTGQKIDDWVRSTLATAIDLWKQVQAERRSGE